MDFFLHFTENMDSSSICSPSIDIPAACTVVTESSNPAAVLPDTPSPIPPKQEEEKQTPSTPTLPIRSDGPHTPFTARWVVAQLRDSPTRAAGILRNWSHVKRHHEVHEQTILEINQLREADAVEAVEELKSPRVFVRGTKGSKLSLTTTIVTLDTQSEHQAAALLDSGCEGS
jgi:hypothetical protein